MSSTQPSPDEGGRRQAPAPGERRNESFADRPHEEEEDEELYEPGPYESYCYDPEDGNYYYYPAQGTSEKAEAAAADDPPVNVEGLIRTYEFDDWEPKSFGWFADIVMEMFFSKAFCIYLTVLLLSAGALLFFFSLSWTFQILFRLFSPPIEDHDADWQALSYLVIFFYLSFTLVSAFCMWLDVMKSLWNGKRDDEAFLGITHFYFLPRKSPPYIVYFSLIIITAIFPTLYAFIDTLVKRLSFIYFVQQFAYVSVMTTLCLLALCYAWFYFRAMREKVLVFKNRGTGDETFLRSETLKHSRTNSMKKNKWYFSSVIMEECGLDGKTMQWNAVVLTVGCVPLFSLFAGYRLANSMNETPAGWGALSCFALLSVYLLAWMTLLRTKSHWAIFASLFLIALMFVLGLVGAGASSSPEAAGAVILLFITCQGTLTRKRRHALTVQEQCALFDIHIDGESHHDARRRRIDTYLCCCRNLFLRCMRCFDVKTFFGYEHPDVVSAQKKYAFDRPTLITDQKVLMIWWLIVMFAMACVIGAGNTMMYRFTGSIAKISHEPLPAAHPNVPMCQLRFNADGSAPLGLYDLTLLSALSYTFAESGDIDFATWFGHFPNFIRRHPLHLLPSLEYAAKGVRIPFSDYVDLVSGFHFITLNSNNCGMSFMRSVEEWSASLAVQFAGVVSPLVRVWSDDNRRAFVRAISFLRNMFPYRTPLESVASHIDELVRNGEGERILLVGDGFNGGYVKLLSSFTGLPYVALNAPGTSYKVLMQENGIQISFVGSAFSYIDSLEHTMATYYLECNKLTYSTECNKIQMTVKNVAVICGDPNGRTFN